MFGLKETLFPIELNGEYVDAMRQMPFMSSVNLTPLFFSQFGLSHAILISIAQNIILTVPFGFGINFVVHVKAWNFLWLSIVIGFGIEIVQLVISLVLGYAYRVIDINDALLNAVGVLLGYVLFRAFAWWYITLTRSLKIEQKGLFSYIYSIATQTYPQIPS